MEASKNKQQLKKRRQNRVRAKISGTTERPRLRVFKSLKHIEAQLIDDISGKTLAHGRDVEIKGGKMTKTQMATEVGKLIAKKAGEAKIDNIVFDRGGNKFHGRIKALADGARENGLKF